MFFSSTTLTWMVAQSESGVLDDGHRKVAVSDGRVTPAGERGHDLRLGPTTCGCWCWAGRAVGKTSICRRFLYGEFETRYRPTLEEQYSRTFQLGGTRLELDVLDTCGDNSFPAMRRVSIAHAQAFLLVFSVDSHSSLLQAADCFGEIRRLRDDYREVPTLLAGNKSDVPGDERQVNGITASNWFFSKMSAESPAPDGKAPAAETDPASFQKARSKSLIRRASRKKAKPAEMTDDQCGVQ
ncbi:GTP-binding protein Rhes [Amphibalanus amphitrite]|uniref:GTP-binding protein Rhes n=1 Tax=Amphibalanus amphitrite TaxID=1232801 RepID=A0A6A4WNX4_AMPAM|nr:GTP-binding protein Rhes [Amphibalanus amphitrite]